MSLSFQEKLQSNYYGSNTYPYVSASEARRDSKAAYNRERYLKDEARRHAEFEADALAEVGLTGHPKAEAVFAKALEKGHSSGYSEVYNWLEELAELVL